jgi:hypothetical protein
MKKTIKITGLILLMLVIGCNKDSKKKKDAFNDYLGKVKPLVINMAKNLKSFQIQLKTLNKVKPSSEKYKKSAKIVETNLKIMKTDFTKLEKIETIDSKMDEFKTAVVASAKSQVDLVDYIQKNLKDNKQIRFDNTSLGLVKSMKAKQAHILTIRAAYFKKYNLKIQK